MSGSLMGLIPFSFILPSFWIGPVRGDEHGGTHLVLGNPLDGSSAPEDNIHPRKHEFELGSGELAGLFGKVGLVQRHQLGDIGDRVLWKPSHVGRQQDVPGRGRPLEVACQGHANDGRDAATVQRISLDDHDRTPEPGSGAPRLWQVGPPDFTLGDSHQSLRFSVRREATRTNWSAGSPISVSARFIASLTRSGA